MQAFTSTFYHLLSNPEYIELLRHDVETAVAEEGWTKAGLDKMPKIDSFFRESQRINGTGVGPLAYFCSNLNYRCANHLCPVGLGRLPLRPFTFSNGVTVPAGTLVAAPLIAIHTDGENYPNPDKFDGFRFAKLREHDGAAVSGQQSTSTSTEFLTFGYGRHAW